MTDGHGTCCPRSSPCHRLPETPPGVWAELVRDRAPLKDVLGPGILFAAGSVGVSHLVQSTRAGAGWGLGLLGVVVLANLVKYPAFRIGPHHAATTGTSLLEGYRRQGPWAVWLYGALTLSSAFAVLAGVTVVTAGLGIAVFGLPGGPVEVSAALLAICAAILGFGKFRALDRVLKVLVAVFTAGTLGVTVQVVGQLNWTAVQWPDLQHRPDLLFMAALFGWMPSAVDLSVWQSLWTLERSRDLRRRIPLAESMVDFHVGYWGTAVLAVCFVLMGAGLMFEQGLTFEDPAGRFAAQLVEMYGRTLGTGLEPLIGVAAFAVMFSTTLAVLDGFPRALEAFAERVRRPEADLFEAAPSFTVRPYWLFLAFTVAGALTLLSIFPSSLKGLIDTVTTLSFLTAPILAWLNHRALVSPEVAAVEAPARWLRIWSAVSIGLQAVFAAVYLYLRYVLD